MAGMGLTSYMVMVGMLAIPTLLHADLRPGDQAHLFGSINENGDSVHMEEMIDGKPLVLAVGSAS